jgi:endonuclease/exonuclease/phosphatase family metal-dependent hydrolase
MSLSVLTYNVKKSKGHRGSTPTPADIAKHIATQHCDVVLCQEVAEVKGEHKGAHCCQIADELHMDHDYGANACYEKGSHGNATFTALPVVDRININVTLSPFEHRGVLHSIVEVEKGVNCHFFNMHLGLTTGQRRKQIDLILSYIEENLPSNDPVIIAGDFNDFDGMLRRKFKAMQNFEGISEHLGNARKTWPSHKPKFQLDHIMFRHLELVNTQVVTEDNTHCLSDHLPIRAEFALQQ